MDNEYYDKAVAALINGTDTFLHRSQTEPDPVLKEMACQLFDRNRDIINNYARRNPTRFAQLIASGQIDTIWCGSLSKGKMIAKHFYRGTLAILANGDNVKAIGFANWILEKTE